MEPIPEEIAVILDGITDALFNAFHNSDIKIGTIVMQTANHYSTLFNTDIREIYNSQIYNWYYGNFFEKLVLLIFQPYLYSIDNNTGITNNYEKRLSHPQIQDVIYVIYTLLRNRECNYSIIDYYDKTVLDTIRDYTDNTDIPDDIRKYTKTLNLLFQDGGLEIYRVQRKWLKRWIRRYRERKLKERKRAVSVIESAWLELLLNPDHPIGIRHLQRLSINFYAK